MVGTAEYFLKYNEDNVMKQALAIEGHLQNLRSDYESEEASCLVKHILILSEQCDEGISHASQLNRIDKVKTFQNINNELIKFKEQLKNKNSPTALIGNIREIRKKAEQLNPIFNLEKCSTCGPSDYVESLSVELQRDKYLNPRRNNSRLVREQMVSVSNKDILSIYGSQLIAKAGQALFNEIDKSQGKLAAPLHERPSVWLNMGLGIGIPLIALWRKMRNKWTMPLVVAGGNFFSKVVDYVQLLWLPVSGVGLVVRPSARVLGAGTSYVVKTNNTVQTRPIGGVVVGTAPVQGRYAITG